MISEKKYLYSFRDTYRVGKEDMGFVENSIRKESFDRERCLLELMFAQYKGDEGLSSTNVQGDFSVIGEEFVNFIATILTSRMAKKVDETGLLDTMSYGELMDDLSSAWRNVKGESVRPKDNDRC